MLRNKLENKVLLLKAVINKIGAGLVNYNIMVVVV